MNDAAEPDRLLAADEPPPFECVAGRADSPFVFVCDHAGRRLPRALGDLGVAEADLWRHIAWDIGAAGVARVLLERLGGVLVTQTYSRLVIDCNRPPGSAGSIVTVSERTAIPGNVGLGARAREARLAAIFDPYHARIAAELDRRRDAALATVLVAVHSFTPVFLDVARPWQLGVLHHRDARLATPLLARMRADNRWQVGDNEPYSVSDATDYAIPVHGEARGIPHVELEIRQDLIADPLGQREWGMRIAAWLGDAVGALPGLRAKRATPVR